MSIFQSLPIQVFIFAMVSMGHGKRKTTKVSIELASASTLKKLSKLKIFLSYGFENNSSNILNTHCK
jgi:hypothetical protein